VRDEAKRELDLASKELSKLKLDIEAATKASQAAGGAKEREDLVAEFERVRRLPNGCWRRIGDRGRPPACPPGGVDAKVSGSGVGVAPAGVALELAVRGPFDPALVVAGLASAAAARRGSVVRKLSVEEEAVERLAEMRRATGAGQGSPGAGSGAGGPGGQGGAKASVRERRREMERAAAQSGASGGSEAAAAAREERGALVTATPVAAKSRRVNRLLDRLVDQQPPSRSEEAAPSGSPGGGQGEAAAKEAPSLLEARPQPWTCGLCSKRNLGRPHACATCGRPRGMVAAPRPGPLLGTGAVTPSQRAIGAGLTSAFGRPLHEKKPPPLREAPQKNSGMIAELQVLLKRRGEAL